MNNSNQPSPEQNPYQATAIDDISRQSDEKEVELASPAARIGAVMINHILFFILLVFCVFAFVPTVQVTTPEAIVKSFIGGSFFSVLLILGFVIWQAVWMSLRGQSIGKRIMGIKVVGLEGQNPGFVGTVLMREIVFCFIVFFIVFVIAFILGMASAFIGHPLTAKDDGATALFQLVNWLPGLICLICLIMLFRPKAMRRTIQDYLAKTIVIKA